MNLEKLRVAIERMKRNESDGLDRVFNLGIQTALDVLFIFEAGEKRREELKAEGK